MTEAEKVAASLTKAQREALRDADGNSLKMKHALSSITHGLWDDKLLIPRVRGQELDGRLTPLGEQVRAHILKGNPDNGE